MSVAKLSTRSWLEEQCLTGEVATGWKVPQKRAANPMALVLAVQVTETDRVAGSERVKLGTFVDGRRWWGAV